MTLFSQFRAFPLLTGIVFQISHINYIGRHWCFPVPADNFLPWPQIDFFPPAFNSQLDDAARTGKWSRKREFSRPAQDTLSPST